MVVLGLELVGSQLSINLFKSNRLASHSQIGNQEKLSKMGTRWPWNILLSSLFIFDYIVILIQCIHAFTEIQMQGSGISEDSEDSLLSGLRHLSISLLHLYLELPNKTNYMLQASHFVLFPHCGVENIYSNSISENIIGNLSHWCTDSQCLACVVIISCATVYSTK